MPDNGRIGWEQQPELRRGRGVRPQSRGIVWQNGEKGRRCRGHICFSDEIRVTLVDHILMLQWLRVQPNVGRTTVSSIILTFHRQNRYVI